MARGRQEQPGSSIALQCTPRAGGQTVAFARANRGFFLVKRAPQDQIS
jgi:hypothetical protein